MKKRRTQEKNPAKMDPQQQVEFIKRQLGYTVLKHPEHFCLDTGSRYLNRTLGSEKVGLVYGKQIIIAGPYSSGKTLLAAKIAGKAQKDGAIVGHVDLENSYDAEWEQIHGVDTSRVALFEPEVGVFGRTKKQRSLDERMQTAEELFDMAEDWLVLQRKVQGEKCKVCMVVDSVTAIQPEEEQTGGLREQNMRTRLALAQFLNYLTKRWQSVAKNTNALLILISQLRENPAQMFGNPEYIPGGRGIEFYGSVITLVKRYPHGRILERGRTVGLISKLQNIKNKTGHGSIEGLTGAFQAMFHSDSWKYMSAKKAEKLSKRIGKK